MTTHLTEHFTLEEMTFSQTATRKGIKNTPSAEHIKNLTKLCKEILEPARAKFGAIQVNSGYRSIALNKTIGGSSSSAHCLGYAADIVPLQATKLQLAQWMSINCPFDQIIMEFGEPKNPNWIHVSCDPRHRKQVLHAHGSPVAYTPITL